MGRIKPQHVALFVPSLNHGGVQRVLLTLANGFAEQGWRTDLVLANAAGPYLADVGDRVRVVDLRSPRVAASLPRLVGYLRSQRPGAIISGMPYVNIVAIWARLIARVPTKVIATEHFDYSATLRPTLADKAIRGLSVLSYRFADHHVGVSQGVSESAARTFCLRPGSVRTIHNPIDTDRIASRAAEPVTSPWMRGANGPLVIAAGRLVKQKDFATLLRAISHLRQTQHVRLAILGDGPLRAELEMLARDLGISDHVLFAGFQDNPYSWMRNGDVFVLSSVAEGLPTVLIEAMACGTPVVSTDCPSGPHDILQGGKWGRLVAPKDHVGLAKAIAETLSDAPIAGLTRRSQDFNVPSAVRQYAELIVE